MPNGHGCSSVQCWCPPCGLTRRSSGRATACHCAREALLVILHIAGTASRRCAPLNSNVRRRTEPAVALPSPCRCGSSLALRSRGVRGAGTAGHRHREQGRLVVGNQILVASGSLGRNWSGRTTGMAWAVLPAHHPGVLASGSGGRVWLHGQLHRALGTECSVLPSATVGLRQHLHRVRPRCGLGVVALPSARWQAERQRRLTPRSSGAPPAGPQARSGSTRYIVAKPGLAACRRRPLNSNVRPRRDHIRRNPVTSLFVTSVSIKHRGSCL